MIREGKITQYRVNEKDIDLVVKIPREKLIENDIKRFSNCEIILKDKEAITVAQRKKAHALIKDIAKYVGDAPESIKDLMKFEYIAKGGEDISLADCNKTQAKEFINVMMDYVLEMGIPISQSGIFMTDDIERYLYKCLENNVCCICGKKESQAVYTDQVSGKAEYKKICLCEKHKEEMEKLGLEKFSKKYCVQGIKF